MTDSDPIRYDLVADAFEVSAGDGMMPSTLEDVPVVVLTLTGNLGDLMVPFVARAPLSPSDAQRMGIRLIVGAHVAMLNRGEEPPE